MKSSNNVIHSANQELNFQSWNPGDFNSLDIEAEESVQNDFSIFKLDLNQKKENAKKQLIKAEYLVDELKSWLPSEVSTTFEEKNFESVSKPVKKPDPKVEIEHILAEARVQADGIIAEAQDEANRIRQEAYLETVEAAKAEMRETLQAAVSVINVAREWRVEMMNQAEPMIMDLVKKMAQKMFGEGVVLDSVTLQQHFSTVLESARSLDDLRIYMNPEDALALGPDWREYQASLLGHKVEIVSNDSIKRGGCYIQGEWGTADALVETQLNAILNQLSETGHPGTREE